MGEQASSGELSGEHARCTDGSIETRAFGQVFRELARGKSEEEGEERASERKRETK